MPTPVLLIVDDHAVARAGSVALLGAAGVGYQIVEVADAEHAIAALRAQRIDLIILDLSLPGRSGLELLRQLRSTHASVPVLVMSGFPESRFAINVLRAGAHGYLEKSSAADELERAVATVLSGRRYVSTNVAELLIGATLSPEHPTPHAQLSDREFDVFLQLARGTASGAIATTMFLSPKTVSTYRTRILEKMAFRSNADLTRYALEHGLIE
jgi:two-component system invasion response regulator UvrY